MIEIYLYLIYLCIKGGVIEIYLYLLYLCFKGGVIEMDEIEEVVEGIFRFAGITVRTIPQLMTVDDNLAN